VPKGLLQVEAGVSLADEGTSDVLVAGEPLLRYGATDRLELRGGLPSYNRFSVSPVEGAPKVTEDGFGDASLGVKYQIGPLDQNSTFDMVVVGMLSIPTGADDFTSDAVEPDVALSASKSFGPSFAIAAQVSAALPEIAGDRELAYGAAVSVGTAVGIVALFADLGFDIPSDFTGTAVTAQAGLTVPVSDRFQVDLRGAFGITNTILDSLIGAGLAFGF
jgi:hypothetical protein